MVVEEPLLSLALLAGRTVMAAAAGDGWAAVKRGFARLLGRGDAAQAELAERRLEQSRGELAAAPAGELVQVEDRVVATWLAEVSTETAVALSHVKCHAH